MVNHPQELVSLYRKFYRADRNYNPSARKSIQPLYEANEIICKSDPSVRSPEMLSLAIAGRIAKLMDQIHAGSGALGRWVISDRGEERQAILDFSSYLVNEVFYKSFGGDVGRFMGKQRGYLEDACELLYRLQQDKENASESTAPPTREWGFTRDQ